MKAAQLIIVCVMLGLIVVSKVGLDTILHTVPWKE
ncbi:hypothetical protein BAMA111019_09685 [Bacillus manliponensis]